jgi:hypothetical protein
MIFHPFSRNVFSTLESSTSGLFAFSQSTVARASSAFEGPCPPLLLLYTVPFSPLNEAADAEVALLGLLEDDLFLGIAVPVTETVD